LKERSTMTDTATTTFTSDQLTGEYTLDPTHTRLGFVTRHAMVTKVRGSFNDFDSEIHIDAAEPARSSAKVVIRVDSIDTRNPDRDAHLRSNDFFAMDEFPTITFESTGAEQVSDDVFRITGDLTIRGVSKPVSADLEFTGAAQDPFGNQRVGFEGSMTLNRKDWGISWNAALETGGVLVSEKVTLEFELSAIKSA
jgi:polyisoprenoid-binding protein YceI